MSGALTRWHDYKEFWGSQALEWVPINKVCGIVKLRLTLTSAFVPPEGVSVQAFSLYKLSYVNTHFPALTSTILSGTAGLSCHPGCLFLAELRQGI